MRAASVTKRAWGWAVAFCAVGLLASCTPAATAGRLSMPVVGASSSGVTYRLTATFDVTGPAMFSAVLRTDATSNALSLDVDPGTYSLTIRSGWTIDRVDPDGTLTRETDVVLLQDTSVTVEVTAGAVSPAVFRFGIGPEFLAFGEGRIGVTPVFDDETDLGLADAGTPDPDLGTDAGPPPPVDLDGDGVLAGVDCDDTDGTRFPGAPELCDGQYNDCEDPAFVLTGGAPADEADADADGVVTCAPFTAGLSALPGVTSGGDCDDRDAGVNPGVTELCDGIDNDCDGFQSCPSGSVVVGAGSGGPTSTLGPTAGPVRCPSGMAVVGLQAFSTSDGVRFLRLRCQPLQAVLLDATLTPRTYEAQATGGVVLGPVLVGSSSGSTVNVDCPTGTVAVGVNVFPSLPGRPFQSGLRLSCARVRLESSGTGLPYASTGSFGASSLPIASPSGSPTFVGCSGANAALSGLFQRASTVGVVGAECASLTAPLDG
jgi:hypothetical protein